MAKVELDTERCKGCMLCTVMCPKGLIRQGGAFNSFGFYAVKVEDDGGCTGCALCAEMCPDIAIEVWK